MLQNIKTEQKKYLTLFEVIYKKYKPKLEFRNAGITGEKETTQRLRFEIYHQEIKYVDEAHCMDEFDDIATVYNCYYKQKAIGTLRFIDSDEYIPEMLQTHPALRTILPLEKHYLEVGRYMIDKKHRNSVFTLPVFKYIFEKALNLGVESIILSCAPHLIPYYTKFGFKLISDKPIARKYLQAVDDYPMVFDFHKDKGWFNALKILLPKLNAIH